MSQATTPRTGRNRTTPARAGKARQQVADAVANVLTSATPATPAAPDAQQVANVVTDATPTPAAPTVADATPATPAQQVADVATARQQVADKGKGAARALANATARKALLASVGNVKRSDLLTDAAHNVARAGERMRRAGLRALIRDLTSIADFIELADVVTDADLKGANVSTRAGSVSAAALLCAMADASSKADALAMFATA